MAFIFYFSALAAPALGLTSILGFSPEATAATSAASNLPMGNTTAGHITNQNEITAEDSCVNVAARGLTGVVAATAMTKLGCAPNGIIVASPFPSAVGQQTNTLNIMKSNKQNGAVASKANSVTALDYVDTGTIKLENCNDANVPINCFIMPPDVESTKWRWTALNYMPRKEYAGGGEMPGGDYQIEADSKEAILAAVNKYVVPLYEAALSNIKTSAENYYWKKGEN